MKKYMYVCFSWCPLHSSDVRNYFSKIFYAHTNFLFFREFYLCVKYVIYMFDIFNVNLYNCKSSH